MAGMKSVPVQMARAAETSETTDCPPLQVTIDELHTFLQQQYDEHPKPAVTQAPPPQQPLPQAVHQPCAPASLASTRFRMLRASAAAPAGDIHAACPSACCRLRLAARPDMGIVVGIGSAEWPSANLCGLCRPNPIYAAPQASSQASFIRRLSPDATPCLREHNVSIPNTSTAHNQLRPDGRIRMRI